MMKKIILASASPRRAALLRQLGLCFDVVESGVCEDLDEKDPMRLAEQLALAKAKAVAANVAEGVVIAADTVVCADGELLGKPQNPAEAAAMLRLLSGRRHDVLTGVAVISRPQNISSVHVEKTAVVMRAITEDEITWYVASGEPFDKAGGYGIQGRAAVFVEKLNGCYFNVVGLPLASLWRMLAEHGIRIWEGAECHDITAPDHQGFAPE
ncbi:MAG: Maf family protein [Bacillota bacterium]|nr:Maf family protein [Bacillota bacterium]MDW7683320.1 Maf family protein [Bacillota bacterium]